MADVCYALSLKQPWATLLAHGLKSIEIRRWATRLRGRILIHASKTFNHAEQDLCHQEPFKSVLKAHGIEIGPQMGERAIYSSSSSGVGGGYISRRGLNQGSRE